jgi:hypothetical protein
MKKSRLNKNTTGLLDIGRLFSGFIFLCLVAFLGGCISVQLQGSKITNAKDIQFTEPKAPFYLIKSISADHAWMSKKTGNTISYLSECNTGSDSSLESLETDSLSAIGKIKNLKTESLRHQDSAARYSISEGEIDGKQVQLALLIFNKKGCSFTLSYGGLKKDFESEIKNFDEFKENFQVP